LATAEKLRTALIADLPDILKVIVEKAKDGDIAAAKTILERVLPPLKAVEVPAYLEDLTGSLSQHGQQILQAMAAGSLAPGQAAQLLGAVAAQAKIVEVDDLARRLETLEKRLGSANGRA
jgi:ubiquinone biosynthesis protein UbiJ